MKEKLRSMAKYIHSIFTFVRSGEVGNSLPMIS